jgi:hypothetical protein
MAASDAGVRTVETLANRGKIPMVVLNGDIVDRGPDQWLEQIAAWELRVFNPFGGFQTRGNHEVRGLVGGVGHTEY